MAKEKSLFQDVPLAERAQLLEDNAYQVDDNETFMKPLNKEEIDAFNVDMSDLTMSIYKDKEELKEVSKVYKDRIKVEEQQRFKAAQAVKYGAIEVTGRVYLMDNQTSGKMEIYSADGMLIRERQMLKHERQLSIRTNSGTHD